MCSLLGGKWLGVKFVATNETRYDTSAFASGKFCKLSVSLPYFSTISTHSRCFEPNIMAQTTNTHTVTFRDRNINSGNTANGVNTTVYNSDQNAEIMCWISPLKLEDRHDTVRTDRHEGVGDWLLEIKEFKEWREDEGGADKAVLFCSGNPGVGKTHLM